MIYNLTKKKCISRLPLYANNFIVRSRGMIGRNFNASFDSMVFNNCNAVHTLFMSIYLDIIFVDKSNKVCRTAEKVKPWRLFIKSKQAYSVIELPAGTIRLTTTEKGDILDLNAVLTRDMERDLKDKDIINMETAIPFKESKQ